MTTPLPELLGMSFTMGPDGRYDSKLATSFLDPMNLLIGRLIFNYSKKKTNCGPSGFYTGNLMWYFRDGMLKIERDPSNISGAKSSWTSLQYPCILTSSIECRPRCRTLRHRRRSRQCRTVAVPLRRSAHFGGQGLRGESEDERG